MLKPRNIVYEGIFYSSAGPFVSILNNGQRGFFDTDGIQCLLDTADNEQDREILSQISFEIESSRYLPLPDLSFDNISGQTSLID